MLQRHKQKMRGRGFEPPDGLTDRISYLHVNAGLILSPARLTRLRYPLAKEKIDDLFKNVSKSIIYGKNKNY